MILLALYDYLTNPLPSNGGVRNRARRIIRHYVGRDIYAGIRPQEIKGHTIVLTLDGGESVKQLNDLSQDVMSEVDVELYSYSQDRYEIAEALKQVFLQYRGRLNADYTTQGIFLESEPYEDLAGPTGSGSDWLHRITIPLRLQHNQRLPEFGRAEFVVPQVFVPDGPTDNGVILVDSYAWYPDGDAFPISDAEAVNGHAWQVGENNNVPQQIYASATVPADTYSIFVRYRHFGINPGAAKLSVAQATTTEYTLSSTGSSSTYDGQFPVNGSDGWTSVGVQALTAGNVEFTIDGPTTSGDAVIVDRIALIT